MVAEKAYTCGLDQFGSNSTTFLLHLNRAATRLGLERYAGALDDATQAVGLMLAAEPALGTSDQLRRGLFRKAQALYAMRQWATALAAFEDVSSRFPDCAESRRGLERAQCRVSEQETGIYDNLKLFQQAKTSHRLDVANFCGPVERKQSGLPGAGQGYFATSDLSPGDLLVADKALVSVFPQDVVGEVLTLNLLTNSTGDSTHTQLRPELAYIQRFQNASALRDVHEMFADASSTPCLDSVNPEHNDRAATYNSFGLTREAPTDKAGSPLKKSGTGLFTKACFFNHSCEPNASWVCPLCSHA